MKKPIEEIKGLIEEANINAKNLYDDNWAAIHYAVHESYFEAVKLLLAAGALLEARTLSSRTPLHLACRRGDSPIIMLLVSKGASITATDRDMNTPLHYICEQ